MDRTQVNSFQDFLDTVAVVEEDEIVLFRGQTSSEPLLPKIARSKPSKDTTAKEKEMLAEFKRRSTTFMPNGIKNDWDLIVYAQHYGMATRLLDWTSNPLAALWFACKNEKDLSDSYIYIFFVSDSFLLDRQTDTNPFITAKTKVFKPNMNNPRIIAQDGWFTVHRYSKKNDKFIALNNNKDLRKNIIEVKVPGNLKKEMNVNLNVFGVNYQKIFPDIEGVCRHINWQYKIG